jgi:Spy/CpxP family protein refolding chaperone
MTARVKGKWRHYMKRRIKIRPVNIFLAVLCVLAFSLVLSARQSEPQPKKEKTPKRIKHFYFLANSNLYDGRMLLQIKEKIGLTERQIEKIENFILEHEAFSIRNSAEIKIKEMRFTTYLKKGEMAREEMEKYIHEISREKTNLIVNYVNYLLDVRALLTPQQLETLKQLKEKKKKSISRESQQSPGD